MIDTIHLLERKIAESKDFIKKCEDSIELLRSLCEHDYVYVGNDHTHEYEKCSLCDDLRKI
jgi:hypothetical protein